MCAVVNTRWLAVSRGDKRFVPTERSDSHLQEDQSYQLLRNLTKTNTDVYWRLDGGVIQDRDGFVELYKNNQLAGKLEVQVRPVDSQRPKKPCYQLDASLVGHSFRAGLPFILVCYDRDKEIAFWKLINEQLFVNTPSTQQSVTVNFDPDRDRIGDGFPYFDRWLEINALHLEAVHEYHDLWQRLAQDIALKDVPEEVVHAYQRYIDTVNIGFDTEFFAVKRILHPGIWKFGICIYQFKGPFSSHRLFRIPNGKNGLLLLKGEEQEVADWFEQLKKAQVAPLGFHSKIFTVRALHDQKATNFLDRPEVNADQLLYKSFSEIANNQDFPLYGEMVCRENLFEFADFFAPALGFSEVSAQLDVADLLNRIEGLADWIVHVILSTDVSGLIQLDNNSIVNYTTTGLTTGFEIKPRQVDDYVKAQLRQAIRTTNYFQLTLSSCRTLLNLNIQTIDRVFRPNGQAPLALSKNPDLDLLKENFQILFHNSISQYKDFVAGNGFRNLQSPIFLNDEVALYYLVDIDSWLATYEEKNGLAFTGQITCCYYVVPNPKRELDKVTVEFASPLPELDLTVTINGKQYQAVKAGSKLIMKIYSTHPLREQIYEMLNDDAKVSYDSTSTGTSS